ncbi:MAG: hypothetical protein ACPGO5_00550 [Patescibacteria group bacterium]
MPLQAVSQSQPSRTQDIDSDIQNLAQVYEGPFGIELYKDKEPKIKLNYITSKMALLYEKLRYSVDYKDDHLLRRSAIERISKRVVSMNRKDPGIIAETLLHELIRAQYLPNDAIPEDKAKDVANIINKYITLYDQLGMRYKRNELKEYHQFIWEIMAAEIEESIIPPIREDALVETLYRIVKPRIDIRNFPATDKERNIQIYIAIHRNIIKSDETLLRYYLFKFYFPNWDGTQTDVIMKVADNFPKLVHAISHQIKHPLGEILQKRLHNLSVYFLILNDLFAENRDHLKRTLSYTNQLEDEIKKAANKRYGNARKKLRRGAIRSVIYIFLTKVIVAVAVEVPYDMFILQEIHYPSVLINVLFPPFLMALIILTTRVPKEKNTKKILEGVKKLVYGEEMKPIVAKFRKSSQFGSASWIFINVFYLIIYLITFGLIIYLLRSLNFSIVSSLLFILFLTLISFFGIRLRLGARELNVLGKRENIFTFIFDLFTLPIIRAGRFISLNSRRINFFIFFLDYVIEAPYKFIVSSFEEITSFVRDKKEEVD